MSYYNDNEKLFIYDDTITSITSKIKDKNKKKCIIFKDFKLKNIETIDLSLYINLEYIIFYGEYYSDTYNFNLKMNINNKHLKTIMFINLDDNNLYKILKNFNNKNTKNNKLSIILYDCDLNITNINKLISLKSIKYINLVYHYSNIKIIGYEIYQFRKYYLKDKKEYKKILNEFYNVKWFNLNRDCYCYRFKINEFENLIKSINELIVENQKDFSFLDKDFNVNDILTLKILNNCSDKIEEIPNNFYNLKKLFLDDDYKINYIPDNFINLEELEIMNCDIKIIPNSFINLKTLNIYNCYNIKEIPNNLINLKNLILDNCNNIKEISINFNNLETLYLTNCPNINYIPNTLTNLKILKLENCDNIKEIPDLIKLEQLDIYFINNIKLSNSLINLKKLYLHNINNLINIPKTLINLEELIINSCKTNIKNLDTFINLKKLNICNTYNELFLSQHILNKLNHLYLKNNFYYKNIDTNNTIIIKNLNKKNIIDINKNTLENYFKDLDKKYYNQIYKLDIYINNNNLNFLNNFKNLKYLHIYFIDLNKDNIINLSKDLKKIKNLKITNCYDLILSKEINLKNLELINYKQQNCFINFKNINKDFNLNFFY